MDSSQVEGTAQDLGGKVKDAVGGLTGDTSLQAEGKADQGIGQLKAFGDKAVDFAKKQPLLAAGITLVVGVLLGRGSKR